MRRVMVVCLYWLKSASMTERTCSRILSTESGLSGTGGLSDAAIPIRIRRPSDAEQFARYLRAGDKNVVDIPVNHGGARGMLPWAAVCSS